jgi:hypothetical protein
MKPLKVLENREKSLAWKKGLFLTTVVLGLLFLGSCAAGPNSMLGSTAEGAEDPAGFFSGLWHGMISFITLIVSFFNSNVNIYEVHNAGWPYNIGFILGVMLAYGGGAGSTAYSRSRDRD